MKKSSKDYEVILASASKIRAKVLQNAGIEFHVHPANISESAIKEKMENTTTKEVALMLASEKALKVSNLFKNSLVVGVDSILDYDGKQFDKPKSLEEVRDRLIELRGKTHQLISALSVATDNKVIWHTVDVANLTMLEFSDVFLESYLRNYGEVVMSSVGAYRLEAEGIQLFSKVDGDYFTILGLPLLPFLGYLRTRNLLQK